MYGEPIKPKVQKLRSQGKTYHEIKNILGVRIPKSTLSYWCRFVRLPKHYHKKIEKLNKLNFSKTRIISNNLRQEKRRMFFQKLDLKNANLIRCFSNDRKTRKIVLSILYLAEGSKTARGSLMFGNSDPLIIKTFIDLLRECYKLDETKFRCTLQCRADQDIASLENFWSKTTGIPPSLFYKARVDKRTIGQVTRKLDYKGVCRIDYFSSAVDLDLKRIAQQMMGTFNKTGL